MNAWWIWKCLLWPASWANSNSVGNKPLHLGLHCRWQWTILKEFPLQHHPQLESRLSQFLCEKVMLYTIFTSFSSWFQPCDYWNDRKAKNRGQPVLEHHGPSPLACFGSNERGLEPFVTAETGRRAWPMVP